MFKIPFHKSIATIVTRGFFTSRSTLLNLGHTLIWRVDWLKVQAGMYAVVDPNDNGSILYLTESEYKSYWKVALSNSALLSVLARPHECKPADSLITAPKPTSPRSPSYYFRKARVYSRIAKNLWMSLWTGGSVVPLDRNIRVLFKRWGETLRLWTGLRLSSSGLSTDASRITVFLLNIYRRNGAKGLVLYLKGSLLIMNKYLAGERLSSGWEVGFPIALRSGLPAFIPHEARSAIRAGNLRVIRVWASILYVYKALQCPSLPSVKTIEGPPFGDQENASSLIEEFRDFLNRKGSFLGTLDLGPERLSRHLTTPLVVSSGPNGQAMHTAGVEAQILLEEDGEGAQVRSNLINYLSYLDEPDIEYNMTDAMEHLSRYPIPKGVTSRHLSRIAFLLEPAGKIRVVAMLDYFTQWALRPLHEALGALLKDLIEDGTYDQDIAFTTYRLLTEGQDGVHYSLDISAATDNIPRELYEVLLDYLWTEGAGKATLSLMCDRTFAVGMKKSGAKPIHKSSITPSWELAEAVRLGKAPMGALGSNLDHEALKAYMKANAQMFRAFRDLPDSVNYTRGQPMGAYSSFPLLALLHHCLIRWAADRVGLEDYREYRVLGDDSVMFDRGTKIGNSYLTLCENLGIPISRAKSFSGKGFFSFASRFSYRGLEVSPVSLRAEIAVTSCARRVEMAYLMVTKGFVQDGLGSLSNNWMSSLVRVLSDPLTYSTLKVRMRQGLGLNAVTLRLMAMALVPSSRVNLLFDLKAPPVSAWMALLRGQTNVTDSYESVRIGTHTVRGPHYRVWLMEVIALLWERIATQVLTTGLEILKQSASYGSSYTSFGFIQCQQIINSAESCRLLTIEDLNRLVDDQSFLSFLSKDQQKVMEANFSGGILIPSREADLLEDLYSEFFNNRETLRKSEDVTIADQVRIIELGVVAMLRLLSCWTAPIDFGASSFELQRAKMETPWFFQSGTTWVENLHSMIVGLSTYVAEYGAPWDPQEHAPVEEAPEMKSTTPKGGELTALGCGELFKIN